jgi:flagellar biosynthesis protein FlhG
LFDKVSTQASKLVSLTTKVHNKSSTKVIAITSGKGGVGKSTLSANIAFLMAKKGLKVVVLDADIGLANMQVLFNVKPSHTFFDYIDGTSSLDDILIKTQYENITLCAGKSGYEYTQNTNSLVFSRVVSDIVNLDLYDILLVDTGAGLNEYVQEFLDISDEILAVTTTDPSAITDAYALMKMLSKTREKLLLCFNHTKRYSIGETITASLADLAQKNRLNKNFMVKYIGNIKVAPNIKVTGRLRKLFTKEFVGDSTVFDIENITDNLLKELGSKW